MQQLLMKRGNKSLPETVLPEGYRLHQFKRDGSSGMSLQEFEDGWVGIRIHSMDWDETECHTDFKRYYADPLIPDDGFFIVLHEKDGIVATATVQIREHTDDSGTVHRVFCHNNHRGKHLGTVVSAAAVDYILRHGFDTVYLTTDDFRLPAVRIYLELGFVPVLYEPDMRGRWTIVLEQLGITSTSVWDENNNLSML